MTFLDITAGGIATSIQDLGRFGAQRYGLAPSGAMDRLSFAAANALVGNPPFAPVIETGPAALSVTARGGVLRIAISGALRQASVGATPCPLYQSFDLADGRTLTLGVPREGMFSYLAVAGAFEGDPVFGSFSVNARAGLGSPLPRPLRAGDTLPIHPSPRTGSPRSLVPPVFHRGPFRVVPGPQAGEYGSAYEAFLTSDWQISASSDRMGYRLDGPALTHQGGFNIVSDGTVDGSIQVTGGGQPIVLMRDRGTTGGYAKIATIISADLGRFAQTRPHRAIRFEAVSIDEAQQEARSFAALLDSLPQKIREA